MSPKVSNNEVIFAIKQIVQHLQIPLDILMETLTSFITTHWLALLAGLVNFIWVYLEYRASIWLWPVGIILPILYIAVSWNALYIGNVAINIYYLIASIIGWFMWLRKPESSNTELPITHTPTRVKFYSLGALLLLAYPVYLLLLPYSIMPFPDTLATLFSLIGMVLLSRKHVEHWWCWIIANSLSIVIFYTAQDYISSFVFSVNLGVSIMGLLKWLRLTIPKNP